jgi:hypothetical protein
MIKLIYHDEQTTIMINAFTTLVVGGELAASQVGSGGCIHDVCGG